MYHTSLPIHEIESERSASANGEICFMVLFWLFSLHLLEIFLFFSIQGAPETTFKNAYIRLQRAPSNALTSQFVRAQGTLE